MLQCYQQLLAWLWTLYLLYVQHHYLVKHHKRPFTTVASILYCFHADAPVNVKVEHKPDVKEGEAVRLSCSSDAHPPANSYQWHNETGAQLHQGNVYMLPNVSRHTGALYCTAINTVGRSKSRPVQLNVLCKYTIRKCNVMYPSAS